MRKKLLFLFFMLSFFMTKAQVTATGDVEVFINNIISNMPSSSGDDFTTPTSNELWTWQQSIHHLLNHATSTAHLYADSIGYEVVEKSKIITTTFINIYNLQGILLYSKQIHQPHSVIQIDKDWATGLYLIKIETENHTIIQKF